MQPAKRSCAYLSLLAVGILAPQLVSAQSVVPACQTTNSLVIGTYGFVLDSGTFFSGVTTNPPGTTGSVTFQALAVTPPGTTPATLYSNTQLGRLLGGLAGTATGAVTGVFYFDGNGNIFASSTVGGAPSTLVGTYTVNNDCTITILLKDAFSTSTPPPAAVAFTGLLAGTGTEIDLVATSQLPTATPKDTTGTTATTPTTTAFLRMVRVAANQTCSVSSLTGAYSLNGTGFNSSNSAIAFLGRVLFDGTGKVLDGTTTGTITPLSILQYTGTYTVNSDCTGTLKLTQQQAAAAPPPGGTGMPTTPTTTPATSITASFVITNPIVQVNSTGSVAFQSPFGLRPTLLFSLASQTQVVSGIGTAQ
jgi:hypothetical protein